MTSEEIYGVVADRVMAVLALDGHPPAEARFDADLHADSLDLLEVVEGVEADLRAQGVDVHLTEQDLVAFRTVHDVVQRIAVATDPGAGAPAEGTGR